jgi:hypothetical protein
LLSLVPSAKPRRPKKENPPNPLDSGLGGLAQQSGLTSRAFP